jgi:hypothetical protein
VRGAYVAKRRGKKEGGYDKQYLFSDGGDLRSEFAGRSDDEELSVRLSGVEAGEEGEEIGEGLPRARVGVENDVFACGRE